MDRLPSHPVAVLSLDLDSFESAPHTHPQAQLIYAISGVVTVTTDEGTWVVPPNRAVWMPAGVKHDAKSHRAVQFRTLLIDQADLALPDVCRVVEVTPLLRELILRLAVLEETPEGEDFRASLTHLLRLELSFLPVEPLSLPAPRHAGLARFCERVRMDLAHTVSLEDAAEALYMSRSSFMRLFQRETGLSFAHWLKQARLLEALSLLAEGRPVLDVALTCGYESPSAFSAMFRRSLGRSPSAYFAGAGRTIGTGTDSVIETADVQPILRGRTL